MVSVNTHKDLVTVVESMQRSIKTLEGSAVGPQTLEEKADMRKPSAPLSFRGSSSVKFNPDGTTTSIINCYWDSVHFSNGYEDTFYTLIKIKSYEIWAHRLDIEDDDWSVIYTIEQPPFAANDDGSITPITVSAVVPVIGGGILYELRVCAIGQDYNNYGDWSQVIQVTSANDLDAPDIPSSPVVSEQANLASVMWNGLPVMPIDFAYCEVGFSEYITTDPDIFGRLYTTENAVVVTPIYDKTCYYYLRSVDFSSNHSVWSTPTSFNISSPETGPEEDAIKDWIDASQKETQDNINKVAQDAAAASQAIKDASIVNTQDFWAINTSETVAPTSGWSSTAPIRTPGSFIWVKTVITFGSGSTTETTPVLLTGNTGVGVEDTTVEYCYSSSGTTAPSSGWNSTVPSVDDEKFLWTRTTITYTNNTTSTSYAISRSGSIGRGVSTSKTDYQLSSSGTNTPSGSWVTTVPEQTESLPFLWTRTTFTYTDNTTSTSYSVSKAGKSGTTTYTWMKYANDASGTGISDDPTGKEYIGLAFNKTTATESSKASDYTWSLFKGEQGIPGDNTYTWVKYADTATGTGMSDSPTGKTYIGLAFNKTTATESTTASDYTWSLIKGDAGRGVSSTAVTYASSASGTVTPTSGWQASVPTVAEGSYLWSRTIITYTDSTTSTSYSVGKMGAKGSQGNPGANGSTSYLHVAYATSADGSTGFSTADPTGATYLGTYTDFTVADSTSASSYEWVKIQGVTGVGISSSAVSYASSASGTTTPSTGWQATVPTVTAGNYLWTRTVLTFSDGGTQTTYSVGKMGDTGATLYTWLKYADTPTSGMSDSPTGKTYMGLATNKTTATESTNYADYTWSLIQGEQGIPGDNTYTWVKYADTATGTGMSDSPTGKTYIGLAFNKTTATESTTASDYTWSLIKGSDGKGVSGTVTTYQSSTSGTSTPTGTWSSSIPTVAAGSFLWTKITISYTDGTSSVSYTVAKSGNTGKGISSTAVTYQLSSSGTTPPTGTWLTTVPVQTTALPYLWTRTTFTYSDSTTSLAYSVSKIGVGIESLKSYYQLKNSSSDSTNYLPSWTTTKQIVKTNLIPNSGAVNNDGSWYAKTSTENIASTSESALWSDSSRSIVFTNTTIEDFSLNLKIPGPNILTLGKTYTASFSINSPYSTKISSLSVSTTGGGTIPHIQQIPDSSLIELSGNYPIKLNVTFIATSDIVSGNAVVYSSWYPENTNQTIEVSMGDLYEGPYQPDRVWFNGSYSSNNIYTPSWVGTINNSASKLSANVINELAQNQCYAILDDDNDIILMSKESATSSEQYVSFTLPQDLKNGGYISTIVTIENVLTGVLNSSWGTVGIESTNYKTNNPVNSIDSYSRDLVFDTVNSNLDIILYLGGYGSLIFSDLQLLYAKPDHLSIPSKPTTLEPSSDWQDTEPTYRKNTILYRVERVLYSDGTFSYTEPYVSTAYQAANAAMSAANLVDAAMQGLIQMSTTEPLDPVQGSIWFELDEETENIIGLYLYTGGSWVPYTIIANKLLVPGSVGVVTIEEGAVEGLLGAFDTVLSDLLYSTKIKAEHIELGEITKNLLDSELSHTVNDAAEWAKKTTLEPGKITISAGENTGTSLIMTPTKLSFIVGNIEVAYIDSTKQELNIKKAVIKESLKVGYHILEKYTDSVTIMRWVGA